MTKGDCADITPSSAGMKGCGPNPDTKEANPKNFCFSLLVAVSGKNKYLITELDLTFPVTVNNLSFLTLKSILDTKNGKPLFVRYTLQNQNLVRAAQFTFQHPQHDVLVVRACSVEVDCVIRVDGESLRQCSNLAEGFMMPFCGRLWCYSHRWPDILPHLCNRHWQLFMFQWVDARGRCLRKEQWTLSRCACKDEKS